MNSSDLLGQIQGLQSQYSNLGASDPNAIYQQFVQKAGGFKPQYDELGRAQTAAYAAPAQAMVDYNQQYGGGSNQGPDAFTRLNNMLQGVGQKYATADALSNGINAQQGNLQGMANSVYSNVNSMGQNLQNRISSLTPLYQSSLQNEQAQAQMAMQQRQIDAQKALYDMIYGKSLGGNSTTSGNQYLVNDTKPGGSYQDQLQSLLTQKNSPAVAQKTGITINSQGAQGNTAALLKLLQNGAIKPTINNLPTPASYGIKPSTIYGLTL